jgi:hypothetical protein
MASSDVTQILEGFEFDAKTEQLHALLTLRQMDIESGMLGKFFGGRNTAPTNIAGLALVLLLLCSLLSIVVPGQTPSSEVWKFTSPLLGTMIGFLLRGAFPASSQPTQENQETTA